ncbi:MAG: hypothetical protein E7J79_01685 [Aggregatibacter aphrophilus]|jgi:hypothetical protein|uniref:hypothetical protein n=1 Tax=Aggregatibacter aphrophilus TaxID=732 RepID=UPI00290EF642|nr:hypothetical protein [Aggregatibacter aphrophilus]MDU7785017.1 hypothetical protein [Aggregatibacter aphrophilus]
MIIVNSSNLSSLLQDAEKLVSELEGISVFENIKKSKFYLWLKKVKNRKNQDAKQLIPVFSKLYHYNRILEFVRDNIISIKEDTISHLISGPYNILDDSHQSENYFFEIDMASRFPDGCSKNLLSPTDIVINDNLFIECKKLHSYKKFEKNIKDANNQISNLKRDIKAFIALDFTDIFKSNEYLELLAPIISFFKKYHLELNGANFIENPNFRNVAMTLLSSALEFKFNELLIDFERKNPEFQFNRNVIGIFYQLYTFLELDDESIILVRGATYLPFDTSDETKRFFHDLASGF